MALAESTSPSIPISQLHIPTGERHPYGPHGSHPNPHPFAGVHCPLSPKALLYSVGISSDISGFLGVSVLLRVNACLSVCPHACLVSSHPVLSRPITSSGSGAGSTTLAVGLLGLRSCHLNRGETGSGSAPSAEQHSSSAGPLLFAASPALPRPPGGREGRREGVIETASERTRDKAPGALAGLDLTHGWFCWS